MRAGVCWVGRRICRMGKILPRLAISKGSTSLATSRILRAEQIMPSTDTTIRTWEDSNKQTHTGPVEGCWCHRVGTDIATAAMIVSIELIHLGCRIIRFQSGLMH